MGVGGEGGRVSSFTWQRGLVASSNVRYCNGTFHFLSPLRPQANLQALSYASPLDLLAHVNLVGACLPACLPACLAVCLLCCWGGAIAQQGARTHHDLGMHVCPAVGSLDACCTSHLCPLVPSLPCLPCPALSPARCGPTARHTTPTAPTSWRSATTAAVPLRQPGGWRACPLSPPPGSQPRQQSCGKMRLAAWRRCRPTSVQR